MKTLNTLFKVLAIYIASHCFKKLLSSEEGTEDVLIKILRDPDVELYLVVLFDYRPYNTPGQKMLWTMKSREVELEKILKRLPFLRNSETYKVIFLIKKYTIGRDLILHTLEYTERLSWSDPQNDPLICVKQFQWIE